MKKYLLILTIAFSNILTAQVLYNETFDNYSVGYLGTDFTGALPGQGEWLTISHDTQTNNFFTIVNETNHGKVLDVTAMSHREHLQVFKPNIDQLIDNRTAGNNVIKMEVDYYTGSKQSTDATGSASIQLLGIGEQVGGIENPHYLCQFIFDKNLATFIGATRDFVMYGSDIISNIQNGKHYLPFNVWIKIIAYFDYPNRKVYFEIPYFNKAFAGDFLKDSPSTNLMQDYKPATILLEVYFSQSVQQPQVITRNRYDNIKITALSAVPPEVINLSTNEQLAAKFNLYPNPATNVVNITNTENMLVQQVTVYDVAGKQLSTQNFNNEAEIQLNVENLASGTYMLHLQTNEGIAVKKLIKK